MIQKVWFVSLVVGITVVTILLFTVLNPFFISMSNFVANDTASGNYWAYRSLGSALPMLIYGIPIIVGGYFVIKILRRRNENQG